MWVHFSVAGLLASLLAASYVSRQVRRNYVGWLRGVLYVLMGWFAIVAALNRFAGDFEVGLLLAYAILAVVVGVGARSMGPVLWFLGFGLLITAGAALIGPVPPPRSLILLGRMAVVALVGGLAVTLFENLPTPVVRCTVEKGILIADANESFEDVFGVEASTVEGKDIDELIVPEEKRTKAASDDYWRTCSATR